MSVGALVKRRVNTRASTVITPYVFRKINVRRFAPSACGYLKKISPGSKRFDWPYFNGNLLVPGWINLLWHMCGGSAYYIAHNAAYRVNVMHFIELRPACTKNTCNNSFVKLLTFTAIGMKFYESSSRLRAAARLSNTYVALHIWVRRVNRKNVTRR